MKKQHSIVTFLILVMITVTFHNLIPGHYPGHIHSADHCHDCCSHTRSANDCNDVHESCHVCAFFSTPHILLPKNAAEHAPALPVCWLNYTDPSDENFNIDECFRDEFPVRLKSQFSLSPCPLRAPPSQA